LILSKVKKMPHDQIDDDECHEVVTEFDLLRLISMFDIVEVGPDGVSFRIDGPVIELPGEPGDI
jgi:hypothetical protein